MVLFDVVSNAASMLLARAKAPDQGGLITGQDPTKVDPKNAIRLLFIQIGIILVFTQALAIPLRRINQPKVIAEVIGGIVLGPSVCGHIPGFTQHIFPAESRTYLGMVANFGLVLFLFIVGLELDVTFLRRNAKLSVIIGMGGMLLPFGIGAGFSTVIYKNYVQPTTSSTHFLVFIGVCFSITAFPVLCRILTALKLLDTPVGVSVLAAGVGNDIMGWVLLALAVALVNAVNGITALYILLSTIAWALFVLFPGRLGLRWLARFTGSVENGPTTTYLTVVLLFMLASAFFTDVIGVHPIFGAFLVGISVPREGGLAIRITEKLEDFVMIIMLPLYFTLSGLNTNLSELNKGKDWGFIFAIATLDFSGKFTGCSTAARIAGFKLREAFAVGSLMSCKGLVELIVLNVGLTAGILETRLFSMFVVEALLLTSLTSPLVTAIYPPKYRTKLQGGRIVAPSDTDDEKTEETDRQSLHYDEEDESTWRSRFLAILDKAENLPAMMSLSQLFQPAQKPVDIDSKQPRRRPCVDAFRLIELSDRTSAVMMSQNVDSLLHTDPVVTVFRTFTGLNDMSGSASLAIVPFESFASTVGEQVQERKPHLLFAAWTLTHLDNTASQAANSLEGAFNRSGAGGDYASTAVQATTLRNLFASSTVDVALFVEPSQIGSASFGHAGQKHLFLPFFGGPDDRLALSLVVQLCAANPSVSATIVRIIKTDELQPVASESTVAHDKPMNTVTSTAGAGFADTMYGNVTTQARLQSETADNFSWEKYQTQSSSRPASIQAALQRIRFTNESTPKPLERVAELARTSKAETEKPNVGKRFVAVVGRSRRMATENHTKELNVLVHERGARAIGSDVRRTLGDVASALVLTEFGAGIVVVQAVLGKE